MEPCRRSCLGWQRGQVVQLNRKGYADKMVVLHELAHWCAPRHHRHTRLWARIFVELVSHEISPAKGKELAKRFTDNGVCPRPFPEPGVRSHVGNMDALRKAWAKNPKHRRRAQEPGQVLDVIA